MSALFELIGVVEAKRVRFGCQRCREGIYPLDEAIGLIRGGANDAWGEGEEFRGSGRGKL